MKPQDKNQLPYSAVFKSNDGRAAMLGIYDAILKQWPIPYEELYIPTGYGNTFILRCGDRTKPPLLLLHGTSSNSVMWTADVAEYSMNYCVYAVDIPGEPGKSEERQYPLTTSAYTEWLQEVVNGLECQKVSVVGLSLGAWVATGFAVSYPLLVEKLVLLCPSGIGRQKVSFLYKAMFFMLQGEKGFDKLTNLVNGGAEIDEEAKAYTKLISKEFQLRQGLVPIYTDEELKKLTMPVMVYAGDQDVLLNSKETITRISKLLPHAKAKLLPGYGHVLIGFTKDILDFLSGKSES